MLVRRAFKPFILLEFGAVLLIGPIAQNGLPADQGGYGGGIGPQNAWAKPYPGNNGNFRQQVKL